MRLPEPLTYIVAPTCERPPTLADSSPIPSIFHQCCKYRGLERKRLRLPSACNDWSASVFACRARATPLVRRGKGISVIFSKSISRAFVVKQSVVLQRIRASRLRFAPLARQAGTLALQSCVGMISVIIDPARSLSSLPHCSEFPARTSRVPARAAREKFPAFRRAFHSESATRLPASDP